MKHFYQDIPGWATFKDLYEEVVGLASENRKSTFVEIGSWLGKSAAFMAVEIINSQKDIEFHCVDPWDDGGPDLKHKTALMSENIGEQFLRNVLPVRHRIKAHKLSSLEGVDLFADGSVDFLMIDGDHSYEAVKADIAAWLPKMRKGGIISGDDYNWEGVKRAVTEAFGEQVVVRDTGVKPKKTSKTTCKYWLVRL